MITKRDFQKAANWTIFHGAAEDPGPVRWDVFDINAPGAPLGTDDIVTKMQELKAWFEMPSVEDAWAATASNWLSFRRHLPPDDQRPDDLDAALLYLRQGGTLCKVPDEEGSRHWRLLVVREEGERHERVRSDHERRVQRIDAAVQAWLEEQGDTLDEYKPRAVEQVMAAAKTLAETFDVRTEEVLAVWALSGI